MERRSCAWRKITSAPLREGLASGNVVVALPGVYDEETMAATDTADEIAFRNHSLSLIAFALNARLLPAFSAACASGRLDLV